MRLPTRRSEILVSTTKASDNFLSAAAIKNYREELDYLIKNQRPAAVKEVQRTAEMGDFSENAAYQMAKGHLRQINYRITSLEEKIKRAVVIKPTKKSSELVSLGSKVTVEVSGKKLTFQILGSQETNPLKGRISYLSPLGAALLNHRVGETVVIKINDQMVKYKIIKVE